MAREGLLLLSLVGVLASSACSSESTNVGGGGGGTAGSGGATGGSSGATGGGAGSGGATGGTSCMPSLDSGTLGTWPDSLSTFCSDGVNEIACPAAGEASYGQDGCYPGALPIYTVNGDVVTDSVTGLKWRKSASGPSSKAAADAYCTSLGPEWRLPTRVELASIVDYGSQNPALPAASFDPLPGALADLLWTSTVSKDATKFFTLNPLGGGMLITNEDPGLADVFARCVQGPAAPLPIPNASCKVVLDPGTGLMWEQKVESPQKWIDALASCEALEHAGYDDWRLPSIKELHTIVKVMGKANSDPTIDVGVFGTTPTDLEHWSSTPYRADPKLTWSVQFSNGNVNIGQTDVSRYFRCVRSAK